MDAMTETVFDSRALRHHRQRASTTLGDHDFLIAEVAERLAERLAEVSGRFPRIAEIGFSAAALPAGWGESLRLHLTEAAGLLSPGQPVGVVADAARLPLKAGTIDAVLSLFALHWITDLPGALIQIRRSLRADGFFIAAFPGGNSLYELRQAFLEAEARTTGGASPRISPLVDIRDAGALLQRAGFAMPVADVDRLTVRYDDAFALMHDLRGMGETNSHVGRRRHFSRRDTLLAVADILHRRFVDETGRIPVTFDIIWMTGWAPHPDQPQPLKPGSARTSLAAVLPPPPSSGAS